MGDVYAVAGALVLVALVCIAGLVLFGRGPAPRPASEAHLALLQAHLRSAETSRDAAKARLFELVRENELLAREVAKLGEQRDRARDETYELRDSIAQRLHRCTCGVGAEVAAELEGVDHG